jgi:hypothetical protein
MGRIGSRGTIGRIDRVDLWGDAAMMLFLLGALLLLYQLA